MNAIGCKSVANVNKYYNQEFTETKKGCYFIERILQNTIRNDTTIVIFVPSSRKKRAGNEDVQRDTIYRNEIGNYSYYKFDERMGYSGSLEMKPILDAEYANFIRIHRVYEGITFEELIGAAYIKSRVVAAQEHSMNVILENTSSNEDLIPVNLELLKGDYFTTKKIHWVVCPLEISSTIKHKLCKKLDKENFELCYRSKYNEYLKDIVEDYQIVNFNLDHEILFVQTLEELEIDY